MSGSENEMLSLMHSQVAQERPLHASLRNCRKLELLVVKVEMLLYAKADPCSIEPRSQCSALALALYEMRLQCAETSEDLVKRLVLAKADVGTACLEFLRLAGGAGVVNQDAPWVARQLQQLPGLDINAKVKEEWPIQAASRSSVLIAVLVALGADPRPLCITAKSGSQLSQLVFPFLNVGDISVDMAQTESFVVGWAYECEKQPNKAGSILQPHGSPYPLNPTSHYSPI